MGKTLRPEPENNQTGGGSGLHRRKRAGADEGSGEGFAAARDDRDCEPFASNGSSNLALPRDARHGSADVLTAA